MRHLLVAGLTAPVTEAERDAANRPPYPVPAARIAPRDGILRRLEAYLPADGDGPLTVTRVKGTPITYRSEVHQLGRPGRFGAAREEGWRAALAVTNDKRIGPGFARFAFEAYPVGDVEGLRRVIAGVLSEQDALTVLARAVRLASGHNPERAAVRTPRYRRELRVLVRDL